MTKKAKNYWLVKQEPSSYSWNDFLEDGETAWDGVRNHQARNNLRAMSRGDDVLFYRSVESPAVVGVCRVVREAYPDPTATSGDWSAVDLATVRTLPREVPLARIKEHKSLSGIALIRQSRLSVMPLRKSEFDTLLKMGFTDP